MSELIFRCSSWGKIFSDPKTKAEKEAGKLSVSAKKETYSRYLSQYYGREKFMSNKYVEKGLGVEEDSLTLYSRVVKTFLKKNEERLINDYITGLPDTYIGESIHKAEIIIDIKSSWDLHTFGESVIDEVKDLYYAQGQGYMALTGAKEFHLVYCLVNTPDTILNDMKKRLAWNMGLIDEQENPLFIEACARIDRSGIFDDIPMNERVHTKVIKRDDAYIQDGYERVIKCRQWLNKEYLPIIKQNQ